VKFGGHTPFLKRVYPSQRGESYICFGTFKYKKAFSSKGFCPGKNIRVRFVIGWQMKLGESKSNVYCMYICTVWK